MTCSKLMQINDNMNTDWQTSGCLDGRAFTRTAICAPPLYPPCEVFVSDPRYQPPPELRQTYASTNAYRQPPELVGCRWCGGTRPTERCLTSTCGRLVPERREKQQLFQSAVLPYQDLSLEADPRCTPCLPRPRPIEYKIRGLERYAGPCVPLKTSQEPVNTKIYQQSVTMHDFTSPGTNPPWSRTTGDRRSFYDRFMADMCRTTVLVDPIPEYGSLGGQISMYQNDFVTWPRDLCDLYKLPEHSRSPISCRATAYATCHNVCNL
ncbi:uncharacterized protein LOC119114381 [Pollicipes pollicipes]|uniref:uncharacterized protein LOC119114381 n=1 Tax=Pollicipes pollicipes TaxID=41117 RepID=UPI0018849EE6|nr:uncharacterized protein LOC119114381 [Pollicipes pollicipes]